MFDVVNYFWFVLGYLFCLFSMYLIKMSTIDQTEDTSLNNIGE